MAGPAPDGLWLFDGVCNFCSGSVNLALRLDKAGVLTFTPIQSPYGQALATRYGIDPEAPHTFLFFDRGRPLDASDAVLAIAGRLPAPWRWAQALRAVPKAWRDGIYGWIARNRYRLLGRGQSCMVPSPAVRARFIFEDPAA